MSQPLRGFAGLPSCLNSPDWSLLVVDLAVLVADRHALVLGLVLGASVPRDVRAMLVLLPAGVTDGSAVERLTRLCRVVRERLLAPVARPVEGRRGHVVGEVDVLVVLRVEVCPSDLALALAGLRRVLDRDVVVVLHVDAGDLPLLGAVDLDRQDEDLHLVGTDVEVVDLHLDLLLARETVVPATGVALRFELAVTLALGREAEQTLAVFVVEEREHEIPLAGAVRDDVTVGFHPEPPERNIRLK